MFFCFILLYETQLRALCQHIFTFSSLRVLGNWGRASSLVDTVEAFVQASPNGYYAPELTDVLHVEVQEPLRHLVRQQHRLSRSAIGGRFLYTSMDSALRRRQTLARRSAQQLPVAVHSDALELSPDELQAAILLFYGLLDEQQRRL